MSNETPHIADFAGVRETLDFDPLAEAERLTGESYKDNEDTMRLGLGLAMMHNQRKESLLRQGADSYFNMDFEPSLLLFADLGFSEVFRETFQGHHDDETFVILWHPDGILATCESYGTHRNNATVYYNYRHDSGEYPGGHLTSSGGLRGEVWVGHHDAREGIRHNLDAMRAEGKFLPEWREQPFLWLLNYGEKDGDYEAINAAKIARLPERIRAAVSPEHRSTPAGGEG